MNTKISATKNTHLTNFFFPKEQTANSCVMEGVRVQGFLAHQHEVGGSYAIPQTRLKFLEQVLI